MAIKDERFKEGVGLTFREGWTVFRLWAPFATAVSVEGDFNKWQEIPLNSENDGYWSVEVEGVEPGSTYKYVVTAADGEKLLRNDPRSLQMTESADGVSVVPDMEFDWGADAYVAPPKEQVVIYEMHIGTFNRADKATIGTFYNAIEKLDYLKELGITTIELMPITSMSRGFGWGYAPNNLYSVESSYGGRKGFMEFVKECHKREIGVILDVVYNHFDGDYLYRFDGWSENGSAGIYFYNDERAETPWGLRPDYGRQEVRQYILDNIKMWLTDYHVDGFRLDSTIFIRNVRGLDNSPESDLADAWKLLGSICELAHETNPQALMIAEDCAGNGKLTSPVEEGGCGFDAQWDLSLPHTLRRALGNTPGALNDLCYSLFLNFNNDAMQKVVFADSHDSAANGSDRITEDAHFGTDDDILEQKMSVLAAAVALTVPGIPMILQGQEFMQGGSFNDWQELEWEKVDGYAAVVEANRQLINLRRDRYDETRGLTGNRISIFHRNDDNFVLGYRRDGDEDETDDVLVIVNFSETDIANYYMVLPSSGVWSVRFNCGHSQVEDLQTDENGGVSFALDGYAALILSKNRG